MRGTFLCVVKQTASTLPALQLLEWWGIYIGILMAILLRNMICRLRTVKWHLLSADMDRQRTTLRQCCATGCRLKTVSSATRNILKGHDLGVLDTEHWSTIHLSSLTWQDCGNSFIADLFSLPALLASWLTYTNSAKYLKHCLQSQAT